MSSLVSTATFSSVTVSSPSTLQPSSSRFVSIRPFSFRYALFAFNSSFIFFSTTLNTSNWCRLSASISIQHVPKIASTRWALSLHQLLDSCTLHVSQCTFNPTVLPMDPQSTLNQDFSHTFLVVNFYQPWKRCLEQKGLRWMFQKRKWWWRVVRIIKRYCEDEQKAWHKLVMYLDLMRCLQLSGRCLKLLWILELYFVEFISFETKVTSDQVYLFLIL